jgi:hypothetical protein
MHGRATRLQSDVSGYNLTQETILNEVFLGNLNMRTGSRNGVSRRVEQEETGRY